MTPELFFKYIQALRKLYVIEEGIRRLGINLETYTEVLCGAYTPLLNAVFSKEQINTIDWWLYEQPKGINGNPAGDFMWSMSDEVIDVSDEYKLYKLLFEEGENND